MRKRESEHRSFQNGRPGRKRARNSQYGHQQDLPSPYQNPIASESSVNLNEVATSPTISELRTSRQTSTSWPWDKAPAGLEQISVRALKLFGVASPSDVLSPQNLPDEILKMKHAKPLIPENSWIYRKVGDAIVTDLVEATMSGNADRPQNLPSFGSLMVNKDSILVRGVSTLESVIERYGKTLDQRKINDSVFVILPEKRPETLAAGDEYLFRESSIPPVVEVLNAVPLKDANMDIIPYIETLCQEMGEPTQRIWKKAGSAQCPYNLTRIFIELQNHDRSVEFAELLGQKSVHGRRLITTINYSPELYGT